MQKILYFKSYSCSCEKGKLLTSFTEDSVITCDEITEATKTITTDFNEK